jgi:hypothetical protein
MLDHTTASPFMFQGTHNPAVSFSQGIDTLGPNYWERLSPPAAQHPAAFGGSNVNDRSTALNPTLTSSLDFGIHPQSVDQMHYANGSFPVDGQMNAMFQPNGGYNNPRSHPVLVVHPTALKSRVETQIPIKLTLFPMPIGVKKLRLPSHAISKPKFFAKAEVERPYEILQLNVSVVCTSAMQDPAKMERAFARARGELPAGKSTNGGSSDEETPLDGAEVKICSGCIQRERKRASRKKQRKPEEDELFQKDEDKRIVVFNTTELKDWVEPPKDRPGNPFPTGAMQVDLPMRIACYCRHQNEKQGFK